MRHNQGFGLIEIIIGSAIMSVGMLMVVSSYTFYVRYALSNQYNIQVAYILEEGVESMRFLRDTSWSKNIGVLSTTTPYYLAFTGGYWATSTTPQYVDGKFLRSIAVSDVKRDANDKIASSGTYDPATKLVTVNVSFADRGATTTKTLSAYITDLYAN